MKFFLFMCCGKTRSLSKKRIIAGMAMKNTVVAMLNKCDLVGQIMVFKNDENRKD